MRQFSTSHTSLRRSQESGDESFKGWHLWASLKYGADVDLNNTALLFNRALEPNYYMFKKPLCIWSLESGWYQRMIYRDVALQIEIPKAVRTALRVRAAQDGTTMRTCVLRALKDYGIEVDEAMLVDRRARDTDA